MTEFSSNCADIARNVIKLVGKKIVVGTPIGIGKPIGFLNELYKIAQKDSSVELTIITGLTLTKPRFKNDLEKRFAEPIIDRLIGDYEDPLYEKDRLKQTIPANIKIIEFFLNPAKYLNNDYVQQNYISSSYTDIGRDSFVNSINVVAQLVAYDESSDTYSTSCSADLFYDVIDGLQQENRAFAVVGEVNQHLPFMMGNALVKPKTFTHLIDTKEYKHLYALPREALSWQDHMIGLYASALVKDDGCLQMGIGKLSNAVTASLLMRHKHNAIYKAMVNDLQIEKKYKTIFYKDGETVTFAKGLYASTEMLCDGYIYLYQHDVLKKRVYDHIGLQTLINKGIITEEITVDTLALLLQHQIIHPELTASSMKFLQYFGILSERLDFSNGFIHTQDGVSFSSNLNHPGTIEQLTNFLGTKLKNGHVAHAGFFVGSNAFYDGLRSLTKEECAAIDMTSILRTNSLLWSYELSKQQRINGRFINTCMMVTLSGELISDGLKNKKEVSGVGGQYDFVSMAGKLPGARSIITCRATRKVKGKVESNIVWEYPNITIPRYLRDVVVTEYGIADLRGKTDVEVIKALLQVTDSRFQTTLMNKAKEMGKLPQDYHIPEIFKNNYPETCKQFISKWQKKGFFTPFPFGCDLTEEELMLEKVLQEIKNLKGLSFCLFALQAILSQKDNKSVEVYIQRLKLESTPTWKEWLYKKLIVKRLKLILRENYNKVTNETLPVT